MRKKDALDLAKLLLENGVDLAISAVKNGHEAVGKVADTYNFMVELLPVKLPRVPETWYRAAPPIGGDSMPVTAERFESRPTFTPPPPPPPKPQPAEERKPAPQPQASDATDAPRRKRRRRRRRKKPDAAATAQGLPLAKDRTPTAKEGPAPKKAEPKKTAPKPAPKKAEPKKTTPKPAPKKAEPKKTAPKPAPKKAAPKPAPKKAEPKKAAPKKTEPKKAAPKKAAPKKAAPKKAAPKKAAPKKAAPKKAPAKRKKKLTPLPEFQTGLVRARREQLVKWCKERGLEAAEGDQKSDLIKRLAPLLDS